MCSIGRVSNTACHMNSTRADVVSVMDLVCKILPYIPPVKTKTTSGTHLSQVLI